MMLKPPRVKGPEQLRLIVDSLGFDWSCRVIDIHPSTMRRYLREASPVPQSVIQALYWLTPWGESDAYAESHYIHAQTLQELRQLQCLVHGLQLGRQVPGLIPGGDYLRLRN